MVILPFLLILPHKKWSPKLIDDHDFNMVTTFRMVMHCSLSILAYIGCNKIKRKMLHRKNEICHFYIYIE